MKEFIDKIMDKVTSFSLKDEKLSSEKVMEMESIYGAHK